MRAPQIVFETTPYQNFIESFDEDLHDVDENIPMALYKWLLTALKVPVILIPIFIASPILSILIIPLVFGFLVIQKLYLNAWQQLQYLTSATCCPLSDLLEDTLQGVSNIRASQASFHFLIRFNAKLNTHNNCLFLFFLVSRWLSCTVNIIGAVFVLITTTVVLTLGNKEDGFSGLVIVFSMQIAEYLVLLVYMSSVLNVDMLAFDRLKAFSEIKQESEWEDPINAPPNSWPDSGLVHIQNLSTAYGEGLYPVLHNISIDIKPGEKVAIIGKEDSGMHTLLYSLFRFIEPSGGEIIIDNIDISKIGLRDLRSRLAIIPQDTLIFNGSVRQNLDPYQEFKDEEIWSALEIADLKAHISSLDSSVERKMSNEKKNLLSIARCVLKRPKIVILDESEAYEKNGENVFQNSTILKFCSHQISEHNGRIIKISSGEVTEDSSSNLTSI
ncbi:multidrug resistance-associated protein 1-like [Stegodyphus dumicola]|uniref:multidrug resistance-associated protein 1-like n=1 Tax=Stegodyphus dumicola TaxID=202533 RepID=UPI0015A75B92|nr:multidrug resistance-associated protein 1-like [Stegodyphus dumicola]